MAANIERKGGTMFPAPPSRRYWANAPVFRTTSCRRKDLLGAGGRHGGFFPSRSLLNGTSRVPPKTCGLTCQLGPARSEACALESEMVEATL